ncbi:MAG: hypothetical protein QNJ36_18495 [Calothrix sp. MO_167.B42]|nr:hypothetical protein [Calothrix sp. MO_167.B42]
MVKITGLWIFGLIVCCFLLLAGEARAGELAERLYNFPEWSKISSLQRAKGDLAYPEWMLGEWRVTSTLVDLVAPLAPDIVTPGFASNRQYLNVPVKFDVKFIRKQPISALSDVVADRTFNGLSLARAYLGDNTVIAVKTDPNSPNRQITFLRGERQLISIVTNRGVETTLDGKFIATEVFQQIFKGGVSPYFNCVESTTAYDKLSTSNPMIEAEQVTAVYLSPQDPNYFAAGVHPVALYRYRLQFFHNSMRDLNPNTAKR